MSNLKKISFGGHESSIPEQPPFKIDSPSEGEVLTYENGEWKNKVIASLKNIKDAANGGIIEGFVDDGDDGSHINQATGNWAHAEGGEKGENAQGVMEYFPTIASGQASHAEGSQTRASGHYSHAEGMDGTVASGVASHAEGTCNMAAGLSSHVEGVLNYAYRKSQHVFGEYNQYETGSSTTKGTYVEIVGNGTGNSSSQRSNARTLDWNGNERLAGSLTLGMGTADETTITAAQMKSLLSLTGWTGGSY